MNNINRLPPAFLKARLRIINSKLDRIPSIHEGTHNGRPVVRSYKGKIKHELELSADQKILLDAFDELPPDVQNQKLLEIIELAKKYIREKEAAENSAG